MSYWAPKPLRPTLNEGLFKFDHPDVTISGGTAIERQRRADGTPITTGNQTIFRPQDTKLTLNDADIRTSQVMKGKNSGKDYPEVDAGQQTDSVADPDERLRKSREVVKAYMKAHGFDEMC